MYFIAIFQSVRKDKEEGEKKPRNKKELLGTHILEMAKVIFFKFGVWSGLPGGNLCSKTGSNQMKDHRATKV